MIKIDKNLKYGLYFLAAFIGGFVIVKIIKAIKDGDDDDAPKPAEPNPPQTQGLTRYKRNRKNYNLCLVLSVVTLTT